MKAREIEAALRAELESHGAVYLRTELGKHNRIWFEWRGEEKFCPFSASPSSRNSLNDSLRQLRTIMDVKRQVNKNPQNRSRKCNKPDNDAPPVLTAEPSTDPLEKLKEHPMAKQGIDTPGIYDLTLAEYLAEPCASPSISSHGLRMIDGECPAKYWWNSPLNPEQPEIESKPLSFGKAAHDWLLMGDAFLETIHVLGADCNLRTNAGKAERDGAKEAGKTVIKADEFETVKAMHAALNAHEFAGAAFRNGQAEKSLVWKDKETGVWLRCRPDWLPAAIRHIPDYKTTISSKPEDFRKQAWNLGYHMQAALYLDGIEAVTGTEPKSFFFVAQEKEPPYVVTCIALDPISIEWGRIQNRKAIHTFAECLASGKWPGYASEVVEVELPHWAEADLQRRHEAGRFEVNRKEQAA